MLLTLEALKNPAYGQTHLLTFLDELNQDQRQQFSSQLSLIDITYICNAFGGLFISDTLIDNDITQIDPDRFVDKETLSSDEKTRLFDIGILVYCIMHF